MRRSRLLPAPLAMLATTIACSSLDGLSGIGDGGTPDAGGDAPTGTCDGAGCSNDCPVIYVAPGGHDDADGCDRASPRRTIGGAIGRAKLFPNGGTGRAIHACVGTYNEGVVVDVPVSIFGGFDCSQPDWPPAPSGGLTLTRVVAPSDQLAAVVVNAPSIDAKVTIADLVVDGPTSSGASFGMLVQNASPLLDHLTITGGAGAGGSIGLLITEGSFPEVRRCVIDGGGTTATSDTGSVGIVLHVDKHDGPHIHDNEIRGGKGAGKAWGSIGVQIDGNTFDISADKGNAFEGNVVRGGSGSAPTGGSVGVLIRGDVKVEIDRCTIDGGSGAVSSTRSIGIRDQGSRALHVTRSKIYGGTVTSGDGANNVTVAGVSLAGTRAATFENDEIWSGGAANEALAGMFFPWGIVAANVGSLVVHHDTLHAGSRGGGNGLPRILDVDKSSFDIQANVFAGRTTRADALWFGSASCTATSFADNFFIAMGYIYDDRDAAKATTSLDAAEQSLAMLYPSALIGGNVLWNESCSGDPKCSVPADWQAGADNLGLVFAGWPAADDGAAQLLGGGWRLVTKPPCVVATGARRRLAPDDLFGTPRMMMPASIGAEEVVGACTP